ncbi:MAG TPA: hypothetical protein VGN64_02285 [Dyadobacter sp.]|jgi:hypothetical protein|nr:hypothetical protein [Dyadobacter sp.]
MKKWLFVMGTVLATNLYSCNNDAKLNGIITVDSEFQNGTDADANGWTGHFAEYSTQTNDSILNVQAGVTHLPAVVDTSRYGFRMQSINRSDDMFMFLKKKVTGLQPNRSYNLSIDVKLVTNYTETSVGIGGSPGSSVFIKAGASPDEPAVTLKDDFYEVNIDKGNQSEGGTEMIVVGNVANGIEEPRYRLVSRSTAGNAFTVTANENGEIWLCVGSDSGYEGLTILYYDRITATLSLVD